MATRADHFKWAETLVWDVRRQLAGNGGRLDEQQMVLTLAAAQVHATLATAHGSVEDTADENERAHARAVAQTEARFPRGELRKFTRADDCAEVDYDRYGDCDGPVLPYAQVGTSFGMVIGSQVLLCRSHAEQAIRGERVSPAPTTPIPGRWGTTAAHPFTRSEQFPEADR